MTQTSSLLKNLIQYLTIAVSIFIRFSAQAQCSDNYEPDNTFALAKLIGSNNQIVALINPSSDDDFYKVHVPPNAHNLRVILSNVPLNYNMILFDKQHQKITSAKNTGLSNDTIIYDNAPTGTLFVRVFQPNGDFDPNDCYTLTVETSGSPFRISSSNENSTDVIKLNVFPSPANQFLTIQFDEELSNDVELAVFDLTGKEILHTVVSADATSSQLDVSTLNSGMYLLKATSGNQAMMTKFSVSR